MRDKLAAMLVSIVAFADATSTKLAGATLNLLPSGFDSRVEGHARALGNRGQLGFGTVIAAVVLVIAVMLAVIVVDQMDQSLGDPSSSELSTAQNDVLQGFADMTSLIGPLLIVAISVVVIGLVQRLRG